MRITTMTALAVATLAFGPLAHAGEGNGDPLPFSVQSIGAVRFTDGAIGATGAGPSATPYAVRDEAPLQPAVEVAEPAAERG